ncbi:DUF4139 domain-containing protein [Candidatus Sumerlaeota bacterium]|nr:DUF4139 domain-containing protein [Candidatus Sumerlaeota bacterium]
MSSNHRSRFVSKWISAAAAVTMVASQAFAKIDLVTLPNRDATELTIYNSQDLTLVRETRTLSFAKGMNEIQFSWANTLIDPSSLQLDLKGAKGLTIQDAVYPAGTTQLIVWNIEAEEATSAAIEITYFSSGLSWSADYVIKANNAETEFELQQFTTVRNNSGEDFDNAATRVVVGEVNLIQLIADLAREGIKMEPEGAARELALDAMNAMTQRPAKSSMVPAAAPPMAQSRAREIIKKAVSEYYLFAVEGKEKIENGWGKELPNPKVGAIPFALSYEIDERKYGDQVVKFYKLKNDTQAKLGKEPLPDGTYYVYSDDGRAGMRFEGSTSSKYVPIGEDIELNLGSDGLVLFQKKTMKSERTNFDFSTNGDIVGFDEQRTVQLEVKNSRDRKIPLKLTHYIDGDWEMLESSNPSYEKVDRSSIRWETTVEAGQTLTMTYKAVFHNGTRTKSN